MCSMIRAFLVCLRALCSSESSSSVVFLLAASVPLVSIHLSRVDQVACQQLLHLQVRGSQALFLCRLRVHLRSMVIRDLWCQQGLLRAIRCLLDTQGIC